MLYIGVDLGGMSIKAGIIDKQGTILSKDKVPTNVNRHYSDIILDMANLIKKLLKETQNTIDDVLGIGIGSPGTPDSKSGVLIFSNNLHFYNVPIREELQRYFSVPIYLENDANVAALAESEFGASKNVENSVMITLGTGIGGGIIINNRIYGGFNSAASELGHMIIVHDGILCSCGQKGCFEKYASASALISQTIKGAKENPKSLINEIINHDYTKINAKTVFAAKKAGDKTAENIITTYIGYLSSGIINIVDILFPEYIVIGGGLGNEGENLIAPLRKIVSETAYSSHGLRETTILPAKMGNDAGIIGAAMLVKQQ
ncbi:MAG: ROK family protein [Clostridiales bacterium]|nr:ROK family protein [Clostridiales bacterium]